VFDQLLTLPVLDCLRDRDMMAFMMVCGGLVKYPELQAALVEVAKS
jgi:hypothetical protein